MPKGEHITPVLSMFPEFIATVANLGPSERFNDKWHLCTFVGNRCTACVSAHETFFMQHSSWSDSTAITNNGRDTD